MVLALALAFAARVVNAAPYAALVMDARTGKVLHSRNADTQLHPASLTKMMTLYIAFEAVKKGEMSLDTVVTVSAKAASEPPSKLGLKPGQRIKLRYLIRAAAVKSANDAATAIGEAIAGSEAAFARRMNRTAKALGMTRSRFKNAHGLTEVGHMSTARDMTVLGRHLFYDHPEYYNLFSRRSTFAGTRDVPNTNSRFLNAYKGADGIKTGYTRAAGYNLVASAERGSERIITTVFGGRSTAARNAKVAELMDLGFRRAPSKAQVNRPALPVYSGATVAAATDGGAGKTIRVSGQIARSPRPKPRPGRAAPAAEIVVAMQEEIDSAVAAAVETAGTEDTPDRRPVRRPEVSEGPATPAGPARIVLASATDEAAIAAAESAREIVTRMSSSGGRHWGINIGRYNTRFHAERVLLQTALAEMSTLDEALRKVVNRKGGFDANFVGLTQDGAALACRRLQARDLECRVLGPS